MLSFMAPANKLFTFPKNYNNQTLSLVFPEEIVTTRLWLELITSMPINNRDEMLIIKMSLFHIVPLNRSVRTDNRTSDEDDCSSFFCKQTWCSFDGFLLTSRCLN